MWKNRYRKSPLGIFGVAEADNLAIHERGLENAIITKQFI